MDNNNLENKDVNEIIRMADNGDLKAMNELGYRYLVGIGVERNEKKAFELFLKASEKNYIKAKFNVALCYYRGEGIEQNYNVAFNMFNELINENEFKSAYFYLGEFYYLGLDVEQDYKKAHKYFDYAIKYEKHIDSAKYYLGEMYLYGRGVDIDIEKAKLYFEDALNEEYDDAYYKLALIYSDKYNLKNDEKMEQYLNKIEMDLCISMIYYIVAVVEEDKQSLSEMYRLLDSEMDTVKDILAQFPPKHPAKIYNDRLYTLKSEEKDDIVCKLKDKIKKYIGNEYIENKFLTFVSDDDVVSYAKYLVYSQNTNNENINENAGVKIAIKFTRDYSVNDENTGNIINYDHTEKVFYVQDGTEVNFDGNNCNTKIFINKISNKCVELQIEDDLFLVMGESFDGKVNTKINYGQAYEYIIPSSYLLRIEVMQIETDKKIKQMNLRMGNYIAEEIYSIKNSEDVLKYNKIQSSIVPTEKQNVEKTYQLKDEYKKEICSLINKINFNETINQDDYLEGGGAGKIEIEYEDGTIEIKEFGSYLPDDVSNIINYIKNIMDNSNVIS